jgi:cytochrome c553
MAAQNRIPTLFGVLIVLTALTAPANTAEVVPDPSTQREFSAKLLVCGLCHGENGVPKSAAIPVIWGQREEYLAKQLHDFESGDRNFEIMSWMAKTLSQAEQGPGATYFAERNWPARSAGAASAPRPAGMAVCEACHQLNFVGGFLVPRLAGQSYEYLVESMRRFADGERTNNADMMQMMAALSPAEREAMARYLSGL